jgi:hypothetical protein
MHPGRQQPEGQQDGGHVNNPFDDHLAADLQERNAGLLGHHQGARRITGPEGGLVGEQGADGVSPEGLVQDAAPVEDRLTAKRPRQDSQELDTDGRCQPGMARRRKNDLAPRPGERP